MKTHVQNLKVNDAVDKMSKTDMGIHYMVIYKDLETLRKFYSQYAKRQIIEKNEAVLINPFYETVNAVRYFLYHDMQMNVFELEREEALLIIDAIESYFGPEPDREFKEKTAKHVKELGKEGLSIFNDTGVFGYKGMDKELVDYELSLPRVFGAPLKRFCLFHQKDFDRLSYEQKTKVIEHHGMTIKIE